MTELVCLVCGLKIKNENYNVNRHGMIGENSREAINSCPFCGANRKYLSESGKPYFNEIPNLNSETLKIIDHAMKLEVFNGDFYKKAANLAVDEELKKMFLALSKIEYMHAMVHKKIGGFKELPVLKEIDYSSLDKDSLLIQAANKREKHAVAYYDKYSRLISDKKVCNILEALSQVEKEHIEMTV
jgi:rubrerythrin